jgi:hypothetical protein
VPLSFFEVAAKGCHTNLALEDFGRYREKGQEMKMIPRKKSRLAMQIASIGLSPLRADDGLVELFIQEYAAKIRQVIDRYPADRIPKVGDDVKADDGDGMSDYFVVTEVKHLLVPHAEETIRAVLLLVKKPHQV